MSELQDRIAARRSELAKQKEEAEQQLKKKEEEAEIFRKQQEAVVLDSLASGLSNEQIRLRREGGELAMDQLVAPVIDAEGLKRSKLTRLLKREARKRWTPAENWWIISLIVSGVCTLPLGFGLLFVGTGLLLRWKLNQRYREMVRSQYPEIFDSLR